MAERFYVNCPLALGPVALGGPEAHHLTTVCRVHPGDQVRLFNGDGHEYPAQVLAATRQRVSLQVLAVESPQRELGFRIEMAAPLPRGDRAHFLLEKLTELGVTAFVPLRSQRSVVHPALGRRERLQRYVIEASKQCGRNILLHVKPAVDWCTYCQSGDLPKIKILGHPGNPARLGPSVRDTVLAVGPEGGFTTEEVALAESSGWLLVDLGPRILRVETAALAMVVLAAACGDAR